MKFSSKKFSTRIKIELMIILQIVLYNRWSSYKVYWLMCNFNFWFDMIYTNTIFSWIIFRLWKCNLILYWCSPVLAMDNCKLHFNTRFKILPSEFSARLLCELTKFSLYKTLRLHHPFTYLKVSYKSSRNSILFVHTLFKFWYVFKSLHESFLNLSKTSAVLPM